MAESKRWTSGMFQTEDWWAFWIGIFFVFLGILAGATGLDLTGWMIWFPKWSNLGQSLRPDHSQLMSGVGSLILSYIIYTGATCIGARAMKMDVKRYFLSFTVIFWLTTALFILSRNAYIQATSIERAKYGIDWSLSIGGAHYIVALLVGLIIGNLFPKNFREFMRQAARPEWFIKIAIVCLGTKLGMKAIDATGFAMELLISGMCATIAAYLLFWPLVYTLARKGFKVSREWAATLASGISICGVSAAIATGGA
ncbi:MAG: YeiH family protein, partial [Desulfohalobiaceae bacterium]|nr:YeiH family protein [Desulfohalobiaceae bacterium]